MGLTIACVFNDPDVRNQCLDRSLAAYDGPVPLQYLPIDNTLNAFSSAGAALNHAVRLAHHEVVVFVHQDVYLHSVDRLATAAAALHDPQWGVLGASGVTADRRWVGRLRDRVILIGCPADSPVEVDSLDEVLFMARRDDLLAAPLSEHPDLAWHAYAVEYSLRMRGAGRRAGAVDTAITHNSLTVNLARLDEAHRHVGARYSALRPIHTTCGTVTAGGRGWADLPVLRDQRWRRTWLRQSRKAARVRASLGVPVVLADIAHEVDLLAFSTDRPLHLLNIDSTGGFGGAAAEPVRLERRGRPILMSSLPVGSRDQLAEVLGGLSPGVDVLLTGLTVDDDLGHLRSCFSSGEWLAGVQWDEVWMIGGPNASQPPAFWSRPQARPLGAGRSSRPDLEGSLGEPLMRSHGA